MSIIGSNILAGASGQAGGAAGYQIERSLRFNAPDSAYLSRTPGSAGNRKTWTWAGWVKRSAPYSIANQSLFACNSSNDDSGTFFIYFDAANDLRITNWTVGHRVTSQVFRDFSSWYHIVVSLDTTNVTADDRIKLYVNGTQITSFQSSTNPALNEEFAINTTGVHYIGRLATSHLSGYLADVHFIDGQALDPSSFGEFDTNGVWQPIEYTGTYGTNGFHLPFSDNSTAAALGTDTSGNGNTWTVNNFSVASSPLTWTAVYVSGNNFTVPSPSDFANIVFSPNTSTSTTSIVSNGDGTFHEVHLYPSTAITLGTTVLLAFGNGSGGDDTTNSGMSVEIDGVKVGQKAGSNYTSAGDYSSNFTGKVISQANPLKLTTRISGPYGAYVPGGNGVNPPLIRSDGVALLNTTVAANDSLVDSPTSYGTGNSGGDVRGNYATLNPLRANSSHTLSNGNLDVSLGGAGATTTFATFGVSTGKWYWEMTCGTQASYYPSPGVNTNLSASVANQSGVDATGYQYMANGQKFNSSVLAAYGASFTTNDVIGIALDMDAGTITFYKNGASQGQAYSGITGTAVPTVIGLSASAVFNFGQRPFAYTAPSGFKALCTTNLPEPTIADGSTAMDVALYTGNGSTQTISGLNFESDFLWIKRRDGTNSHQLTDSVRGLTKYLFSDATLAEETRADQVTATSSTGFSLGSNAAVNTSPGSYVA